MLNTTQQAVHKFIEHPLQLHPDSHIEENRLRSIVRYLWLALLNCRRIDLSHLPDELRDVQSLSWTSLTPLLRQLASYAPQDPTSTLLSRLSLMA